MEDEATYVGIDVANHRVHVARRPDDDILTETGVRGIGSSVAGPDINRSVAASRWWARKLSRNPG